MGAFLFGYLLLAALLLFAVIAGAIFMGRALWKPQHQVPQVKDSSAAPPAFVWPVVVDDVEGTVHQAYGGLANPTYLTRNDGLV